LKIKKFKGADGDSELIIAVDGEWESKENFKLAAAFLPKGLKMNLFKLLIFNLQRIEIGKKNDNFYIEADTKITFPSGSFGEKLLGKKGLIFRLSVIMLTVNLKLQVEALLFQPTFT
jgi:hypothetical protein